jgi:hypothetical protein
MTNNWKLIHSDFTEDLRNQWEKNNFTYNQTQDWINIGLTPDDCSFAVYLRDVLKCEPEEALNFVSNLEELRNQYQEYLQYQEEEPESTLLERAISLSLGVFDFGNDDFEQKITKLSDQELELYFSEKRLDLKKYFVFNLGQEVKITPKITVSDSTGEIVSEPIPNIRQVKPLLTEHLTQLFNDGNDKSAISFTGKNTNQLSLAWTGDKLDQKIRNGEEVYIVFDKSRIKANSSYVRSKAASTTQLGEMDWPEIIVLAMEAKPQVQVFQSKKNALKFLREEDFKASFEKDKLKRLVKKRTDIPGEIEEVNRFETWWNKNLATVISNDYWVFLLVYEPKRKDEIPFFEKLPFVFPSDYSCQGNYGIYVKKREKHNRLPNAQKEAEWLRNMLNEGNPILVVHHLANKYDNLYWIITSPYVEKYKVGWYSNNTFYWPANLDYHIKPLSVIRVEKQHTIGRKYYHVGVYIGDNEVFHIYDYWKTKDMKSRIDDIKTFLGDAEGTQRVGHHIEVFQPVIPFREWKKIIRNVIWADNVKYWNGRYCLANRNCEHLANMMVYGINYSKQVAERKALSRVACKFSGSACRRTGCGNFKSNNGKDSICLRNEIEEVNGKLGEVEVNNQQTKQLEARVVVPDKIPTNKCRIM